MHTKLFIGLALAGLVAPCGTALAVDPAAAADPATELKSLM